jgi:hypothetical protein
MSCRRMNFAPVVIQAQIDQVLSLSFISSIQTNDLRYHMYMHV